MKSFFLRLIRAFLGIAPRPPVRRYTPPRNRKERRAVDALARRRK